MTAKKSGNRSLVKENDVWHNRPPIFREQAEPIEKKYRQRSIFQSDLF